VDVAFDASTLPVVRAEARGCAIQAGLSGDRVADVVLAIHELAANAVIHGSGAGRMRAWNLGGALHFQVDDGDLLVSDDPQAGHGDMAAAAPRFTSDHTTVNPLPCEPGHGLHVVQQVADRMQSMSGSRGITRAAIAAPASAAPVTSRSPRGATTT
jgi:anti-sigma regulatory factor (Ser/Thr protein kinase)